jgi:hypothetical protein
LYRVSHSIVKENVMLRAITLSAVLVLVNLSAATVARAAMFLHWNMNGGPANALLDSVGTNHLVDSAVDSNGAPQTSPTYLPTGGAGGSGAFRFNPSGSGTDILRPTTNPTMLHPGMPSPNGSTEFNFTTSFWIRTTDAAQLSNGGSSFAFQLPVLGDRSGQWAFELGVDGGKPGFFHWDGSYFYGFGNTDIADGLGHYVTFVHRDTGAGTGVFDIYVDGVLDVANLNAHDTNADIANGRYRFQDIGRMNSGATTGLFDLDDVRLFDTALSASEIADLFGPPAVPEPRSAPRALD